MNLILNFPKDEKNLKEGVAIFKAILISRSIDNLEVEDNKKQKIKEKLIKELVQFRMSTLRSIWQKKN